MAVALTLSMLRQEIAVNLGEQNITGSFTNAPGTGTSAIDTARWDGDGIWDNGWIQDTTLGAYPITRINTWVQSGNTFTLFAGFSTSAALSDAYEVHTKRLSFDSLRRAVNRGIALCGKSLRTLVRDETQTLAANTYQYTPNYGTGSNRFFPGGVVRIEFQYWVGQPTRQWIEIPSGGQTGWRYLDDETIQFPEVVVDAYTGNSIRFTGYGPLVNEVTTDQPSQVLATFDDDQQTKMLIWASTHEAWGLVMGQMTANERTAAAANAQYAMQQFDIARLQWSRNPAITRSAILPVSQSGWSGS